jgi:protein-disulfide isomerase
MRTISRLKVLAFAVIAGFGFWAGPGGMALAQETTAPATATTVREVPDMVLGNPDAKVTLTEYASFTCPHCAAFHLDVFKPLKADYIDTGKVRFIYREVFFDRYGLWAAMVARCGGPTRYFGISAMLFEGQREWAGSDDQAQVVQNLRRIGKTAGMDDAQLDACLNDGEMAQAMVANYQTKATADGIESTPTLLINGVKHSNMSYEDLKAILDAELAK